MTREDIEIACQKMEQASRKYVPDLSAIRAQCVISYNVSVAGCVGLEYRETV